MTMDHAAGVRVTRRGVTTHPSYLLMHVSHGDRPEVSMQSRVLPPQASQRILRHHNVGSMDGWFPLSRVTLSELAAKPSAFLLPNFGDISKEEEMGGHLYSDDGRMAGLNNESCY